MDFETILQIIYFLVPIAFANMSPVLVKKYFSSLAKPLDFNKTFLGERIFGDHKTWRGLLFGIIGGILGAYLQFFLSNTSFFKELSLVNFQTINVLAYGFLTGLGVIIGDTFGSFLKRRFKIPPGASFIPFDQIVAPLGAILFLLPLYKISFEYFLIALLISFFCHILIKWIGYSLKIEKEKW